MTDTKLETGILFVATQYGSFNVVYPALKACCEKYRAGYVGVKDIPESGLAYKEITENGFYLDLGGLCGFDMFVTGTSPSGDLEYRFWDFARSEGKKSIAVLDAPKDCRERFIKNGRAAFPDIICVPDERSEKALIELGMAQEGIVITGSPYLEGVDKLRLTAKDKEEIRKQLELKDKRAIVFCTEYIARENERGKYGYDEVLILEHIAGYIKSRGAAGFSLFVRLHPMDSEEVYDSTLPGMMDGIEWRLVSGDPDNRMLQAADVVIGMTSTILVEASLLGLKIISYQPVSEQGHAHIPHDIIQGNLIMSRNALYNRLDLFLGDKAGRPHDVPQGSGLGATERIMSVIENAMRRDNLNPRPGDV